VLAGDAAARVATLRAHLAPGTLVAVIDAHATIGGTRFLAEELGLTADSGVGAALASTLVPVQFSLLAVENRWTALAWFGRVPGDMNGPLCEALDSNP